MAQEPSSKDLLEAVKQQESGGRRYKADGKTLLEGPQTKYGTAKGEMQVLDMTNRDPGYGVKPARDDSPDERARVGRDYLNAMVNKYGNRETALVAYNWGPGNTDKWLDKGGDFSKLPKETQNYVTKITGALGSTKLAQAPAAPKTKTKPKSGLQQAVYKAAPLTHPMLSQLGPNYQAAMAVSMLADEDEKEGKSEYEPSESEKMLTEATARPVALSQVDLGYQSPFPELNTGIAGVQKQPVKMAAGGVPYAPTAMVRPSARAQLNDVKAQWDAFNNKATDYNTKADEYNKQVADYQKLVDAYNAGPRTEDFTGKEPTFTYTAPTEPTVSADQYQGMADAAKKDVARRSMALSVASNPEQYGLSMNKFFADGGQVSAPYGGVVHRADGSPDTGEYFQDPMGVPDSGPITADTLAKGKEFKAADALKAVKEVGRGVAKNVKAVVQGVSETPYNLVGGVADVGNLALTPFGLGSKEPMLGSEHLKRLALEKGIRQAPPTNPQERGMYMMGELGASVVNPAGVVRGGVQAADKVSEAAKMLKKVPPAPAKATTQTVAPVEPRPVTPEPMPAPAPVLREAPAAPVRQAEPLPAPPEEVVVPQEMLETVPAPVAAVPEVTTVVPPMQAGVPADRPFVGRLDAFVDTIKNPVQLGQLKGQLKGKFRDYDIERVERAFVGMDDKTKLTPDQIKQALAGVHSPGKWISETLPPKAGAYHQTMDNVWGAPLGTTNLYLEQAPEALEANALLNKAAQVFSPFFQKTTSSVPTPEALAQARALLSEPEILKVVDPKLIIDLSKSFDRVEKNVGLVKEYSGAIKNISDGFEYPILYKDAAIASDRHLNQPFFKFSEEALAAEREALKQKFMAQGADVSTANVFASNEIRANLNLYDEKAKRIASQKVQELAIAEAQKHGIDIPDVSLIRWDELNDVTRPMAGNNAFKESLENALEPARVTVHEAIKNIKNFMDPEIKKVGDILYQRGNLYEGKHKYVAGKPYPIGFTRFSEHEATVPGIGAVQGRHFHELQSDLSKDMRKSGTTSGNEQKDIVESNLLRNQIGELRNKAFEDLSRIQQDFKSGNLTQDQFQPLYEKIQRTLDEKVRGLENRMYTLTSRVRDKASYSLEEPFAGFETNQMVRQQLLMKNAIQSAMRDGKSFATFPGNESAKPALYVDKVQPNLKQVIKDLGGEKSGLELRQIELPPDKDGRPITATGVVWSPEAAARIMKTGVPFAKGGAVERLPADDRRYL